MKLKIKKFRKKDKREIKRFAEYMVGGGVWFWSGYIIIVAFTRYDITTLFWANFIGNAVGITLNFLIARYWVFKTRRQTKLGETTVRYVVYTALNAFLLNYLILRWLQDGLGIGVEIGQFIASAFFTVWNYYWYKVWVFKGRQPIRKTKHHA